MASNPKLPPPPSASNGVITGPPKGVVGGNRKKQKRRAKQAAARSLSNSHPPPLQGGAQAGLDYDEDPLGYGDEDEFDYSDADHSYDQYLPSHGGANGYSMPPPPPSNNKKKKKKKSSSLQHDYNPELLGNSMPPLPHPPPPPVSYQHTAHKPGRDQIWNTSSQQERQNIKEFWLSLSEEERKSLLKIEKEAVLRKMKQQQKHSCSCTVCGRKRTAIEEELEVLYEGYYEELEQYAHHDQPPLPLTDGMVPDPLRHRQHPFATPPPNPQHRTSQLQEHFDDDEYSDEEEEIDYSEDEFSDEEIEHVPRNNVPDLFNFGQNLTVKGILTPWLEKLREHSKLNHDVNLDNLLTVADDLLKNDGRKFIEMMEQLAERRMQRESEAEYAAANPSHPGPYPPGDAPYGHDDPLGGDEFDDDEESYASGEEYDEDMDDEDDMVGRVHRDGHAAQPAANQSQGGLTEEQRMQEGRRMFQIFAARMFEQRVLTAYKEKVAAERQQKLLEELEDESKQEAQREPKKQRDAQKKKDKKKQAQQAKAEEKAKKEAEKAAEEARLREAEEKKQEEQRRKKEEQRKKKEDEKRKQDEERAKKEAEKARRQQEEQQRREEAERKAREAKAAEKAKKEEARKREREEREAREKEARERKAQEEKEKRERDNKLMADKEAKERERSSQSSAPSSLPPIPQIQKRPSQPGLVAVPGVYPKQTPSGVSSPHPSVATPAVPKAPTPAKQRQASQQGSHGSSPKQSHSQVSSIPSKSSSPNNTAQPQQTPLPTIQPKTVLQKPSNQPLMSPILQQGMLPAANQPLQHPPGMPYPQQNHPPGFGGMPPIGFHSFQGGPGPMMHGMVQRGPGPMYPQGPQMSSRFGAPNMNGPPPGMMPPQGRGAPFPFDGAGGTQPPPGFPQQQHIPPQSNQITPPIGPPSAGSMAPGADAARTIVPSHSRQQSASDKERFESAANQPIARPAPIQPPSNVKPQGQRHGGSNSDIDDLSAHLGSSALIGDDDEPMPSGILETRRSSNIPIAGRGNPINPIGGGFGAASTSFGASPGWNQPGLPFGQSGSLGQQGWGGLSGPVIGSWSNNSAAFGANGGFGAIGGGHMRPSGASGNRPLMIRLAVCQACKQLDMTSRNDIDGFHSVDSLLHHIAGNRTALDPPPTLHEISEICETEGDSQNGGGELARRDGPSPDRFSVKWTPDAGTPDLQGRGLAGLGEIGSPMPIKASPATGFGAPGMGRGGFPNLGILGPSSGYQ